MSTKKLQIIGGSFGGNSIQTDDTLTKTGHAADAKATGDAIRQLQADIDEVAGLVGDADVEYYTEEEIDSMMADLNAAIDSKSNFNHVHDDLYYTETEIDDKLDTIQSDIDSKVDTEDGKGLSTNDYTTAEKDKLATVEPDANFYEHPTHDSHSSGLYKVTVDESGHVSGATLAEKEDIVALGIPAQDTTYSAATTSTAGLMSTADKIKLDGIDTNANKITVDSSLSSTSTNPVQNKVVNTAISSLNTLVGDKKVSEQITSAISEITHPVTSVNSRTGAVTLSASDVGAAAASHGNHVPATETANNAKFLRNDNTWQTVTPANIGAAESNHGHKYAGSASDGGSANAAVKLETARAIKVKLGSTSAASFDGTGDITPGVSGTLPIARGGTGATSASAALTSLGAAAAVHNHQAETLAPGNLEFHPGSSAGHGGYIDFHYNDSSSDYTSRIIESNGLVTLNGSKIMTSANVIAVMKNISFTSGVGTYTNSAITTSSVVFAQWRAGGVNTLNDSVLAAYPHAGSMTIVSKSGNTSQLPVLILIINP